MRGVALFLGVLLGSFGGVYIWQTNSRLEALASENEGLRLREAARVRRKDNGEVSKVPVNEQAVLDASRALGIPAEILRAVRLHENGSPLEELGHKGKTEWIALNVSPNQWQYWEASRTLNKSVWEWALKTPKRRKELFDALAVSYTAPPYQRRWAKSVRYLTTEQE